jgi:hypothetical protein
MRAKNHPTNSNFRFDFSLRLFRDFINKIQTSIEKKLENYILKKKKRK